MLSIPTMSSHILCFFATSIKKKIRIRAEGKKDRSRDLEVVYFEFG